MSVNREVALKEIADIPMPDGKTLAEADIVRAFNVDGGTIRFVLEVADSAAARALAPVEAEARYYAEQEATPLAA